MIDMNAFQSYWRYAKAKQEAKQAAERQQTKPEQK